MATILGDIDIRFTIGDVYKHDIVPWENCCQNLIDWVLQLPINADVDRIFWVLQNAWDEAPWELKTKTVYSYGDTGYLTDPMIIRVTYPNRTKFTVNWWLPLGDGLNKRIILTDTATFILKS